MDVLTTTEVSKKWNISPRRIARLASLGRIPGAKFAENRWLIPVDAEKPCDTRYKSAKTAETKQYIFPYVPAAICHDHPADLLSSEEKLLYGACMQYESGEYENSIAMATGVMNRTANPYIRIGCLYVLIFSNILLHRYEEGSRAILLFFDACREQEDNQYDISLFANETGSFFYGKDWFLNGFSVISDRPLSNFTSAYLSTLCALQDLVKAGNESPRCSLNLHELSLSHLEKRGYAYFSMLDHYYLSLLYAAGHNSALEYAHLKKACDIAIGNHLYSSLAGYLFILPDRAYAVLAEYPEDIQGKINNLIELSGSAYAGFKVYSGSSTSLTRLSKEDYILIAYCLRQYTLEKIAELEKISLSKAKRKMITLYKKVGVKGKAELCSAYSAFLNNKSDQ